MRVPRALRLLVAAGLMMLLGTHFDGASALRMMARADPVWLLAALMALTTQTVLSAWRWRLTAARLGVMMTPARAVQEYYLAQIVNQSLPGGVAGDVGRALRSRHGAGLAHAASAVMIERLSGQIAMMLLTVTGVVGVTIFRGGITLPVPVIWLAGVVSVTMIAIGVGLFLMPRLAGLRADIARALLARGVWQRQAALSLCTAGLNLLSFDLCARAIGANLSLPAVLVLVPLILVTMLLPLTVSGWGLREGVAAVLFPLAGASGAAGLAASVAFGVMFLISSLPGIAVLVMRRGEKLGAA